MFCKTGKGAAGRRVNRKDVCFQWKTVSVQVMIREMGNVAMSFEQKVQLAIVIILTGMVIVFFMLIFLTYLIKGYGAVIGKLLQKGAPKKPREKPAEITLPAAPKAVPAVEAGVSGEVVAAISAAVYIMYGVSAAKITSIRRAPQNQTRSAWSMAGLLDNTRPF